MLSVCARARLPQARAALLRPLSTAAAPAAVPLLIDGKFVASRSQESVPVHDPATQRVIATTPIATQDEMRAAVEAARAAFPAWSATSVSNRARVFFKYQALLRKHEDELAALITLEHGKTIDDARGDLFRGLEVVEHACSITSLQMGETVPGVATSTDVHSYRVPLGVCAGIAPFNFPAMVPLWMFPMAIACGNTYVLKPSERVPLTTMRLAELAMEAVRAACTRSSSPTPPTPHRPTQGCPRARAPPHAQGLPDGVLNVIHGQHDAVNFVCDAPEIRAISFVGGDAAGKHIYERGGSNGKRVQANLGAQNHAVVLEDADANAACKALVAAAFGAAGQRCMAISRVILVGGAKAMLPQLAEMASGLVVGPGNGKGVDVPPVSATHARGA